MYRYVGGRQTYYPRRRSLDAENRDGPGSSASFRRPAAKDMLTEEQRLRLQSFIDRFDATVGSEPALRLIAAEVHTFSNFQACKVLQRLTKKFGNSVAADARLLCLVARCADTMFGADGISISRALWAFGRLGLGNEKLLDAASLRIPFVLADCGPITMATIWNAFEVLQFESSDCLDAMAGEIFRRLSECDPPEIAIVLHAAAQLRFETRDRLFATLLPWVRQHEDTFSLRHLAVCFHAAARMSLRDEELCRLVVARFSRSMFDVDALALTSVVYACGLIAYVDEPFLEGAANFVQRALSPGGCGLEPQQVSNITYAFGKLGFCPEGVLHSLARHAAADLARFKAQELSNITYAHALLKFRSDAYLAQLSLHLTQGGRAHTLDAQSVVLIAYAYALLECAHQTTLRALGDAAIPKLPEFKGEEFSIMVYSLGLLNFRHHDLLRALVEHAPKALPRFSTQNLSNMLHGLGLVGFDRDDGFIRGVASHLAGRLKEASAQDIANSLTALMRMCVPHELLARAIADHVTSPGMALPLSAFTPQEIANTVYGFDALQVFDANLFEQVALETARRLDEFIPQEVANVIWAFTKQSFGSLEWFEDILGRCAPYAEAPPCGRPAGHTIATDWCGEDFEKPLAALWSLREQLPSYARLERVFRARFLDPIAAFLRELAPDMDRPAPSRYQRDFAAWDLYQVGPSFTEELLAIVGVRRISFAEPAVSTLLEHYAGEARADSLLARFGEKVLLSVLPAARWVSCHVTYRLTLDAPGAEPLQGALLVEAARPDEDEDASQRRLKAEVWREPLRPPGASAAGVFRPVLLSTFLGNWRHRHAELVALDALVELALGAMTDGRWPWTAGFWSRLSGHAEFLVPHTPCLSCVGAFTQLRRWAPRVELIVSYEDWRDWRRRLQDMAGHGIAGRSSS
mmetsp:Transcript_9856/g.25929  ORF Transcript_9856/g.25929 Transcript_9856/m.25929 type:complete len:920 (-) Transcript_9856:93-2852(-)